MRTMTLLMLVPLLVLAIGWWPSAPPAAVPTPAPASEMTSEWWQTVTVPKPTPIPDQAAAIARATRARADLSTLTSQVLFIESSATWRIAGTSNGLVLATAEGCWFSVDYAGEFSAVCDEPMMMPCTDRSADPTLAAAVLNRLAVIDDSLRICAWMSPDPTLSVSAHPTPNGGWTVRGWQHRGEFGGHGWSVQFTPDGAISGGFASFRACGGVRTRRCFEAGEPSLPVGSG